MFVFVGVQGHAITFFFISITNSVLAILGRFTKEGVLVEGLFWKDVERLIDDYNNERKSK